MKKHSDGGRPNYGNCRFRTDYAKTDCKFQERAPGAAESDCRVPLRAQSHYGTRLQSQHRLAGKTAESSLVISKFGGGVQMISYNDMIALLEIKDAYDAIA